MKLSRGWKPTKNNAFVGREYYHYTSLLPKEYLITVKEDGIHNLRIQASKEWEYYWEPIK